MKKHLSSRRYFVKTIASATAATAVSPLIAGNKVTAIESTYGKELMVDNEITKESRINRNVKQYKVLFNHDGACVFTNASIYQNIKDPVSVDQVQGYVDEVAAAGCDVLLLSPAYSQTITLWDSKITPFWSQIGNTMELPDNWWGASMRRIRDFLLAGNDFIGLTQQRAREKGLAFFLSWRMNDVHRINYPDPWLTDFYRNHPEYRIGNFQYPLYNADLALDFSHPEVRDHQLKFISELVERYAFDGIELDFMRNPYFFPRHIPFGERSDHLIAFFKEVRRILDTRGKNLPIGVRVPHRWDLTLEIGLDLKRCVTEGLVDMVNLAPFYETSSETEVMLYRKHLPKVQLFGELTHCTETESLEWGLSLDRKCTPEILRSTAQSFLAQGADGISLFNFVYYRDYSLGNKKKLDNFEPPFSALRNIAELASHTREAHHYVVAKGLLFYYQLPLVLTLYPYRHQTDIYVGEYLAGKEARSPYLPNAILRLQLREPSAGIEVEVFCSGRMLKPCRVEGELFPAPYLEGIPTDHSYYLDYEVPLELIEQGLNPFTVHLYQGKEATVTRMELALYRKDGYHPVQV